MKIGSLKDKIIQKAFLRVLSPLFEGQHCYLRLNKKKYLNVPIFYLNASNLINKITTKKQKYFILKIMTSAIFSTLSFGFRTNKNVHSLMREIRIT